MPEPILSYVIAAWNAAGFITQAVKSALDQNVSLEVIVVDDASTDETEAVVRAMDDPRVRYHRQAENGGPAKARNTGFALAKGRWIGVLDADDYLLPGRTAQLLTMAERHDLDICADNVWIDSNEALVPRRLHIDEALDKSAEPIDFVNYCAKNHMFGAHDNYGYLKPIFRTSFLHAHSLAYRDQLRIGEDFLLVAESLLCGARSARLRYAGYVYMTRSGSISHRLSTEHAAAMIAEDERLLNTRAPNMTPKEAQALMSHLRSLRSGMAFTQMVEAIKRRRLREFAAHALTHPEAILHFKMPLLAKLSRLTGESHASAETLSS